MRYLKTVLEELDIRYTMPVQPILLPHPPNIQTQSPQELGNAGFFQGSNYGRSKGKTFKTGIPSFDSNKF